MKSSKDQFADGADPGFAPISRYDGCSWYGGGESVGFGWLDCSGKSSGGSSVDFELDGSGWGYGLGSSAGFVSGIGYGAGTASDSGHLSGD